MDAALEFYKNLTTLSFTLLALWFVVLQLSDRLRTDPRQRATTLHVALHFFLPGMMGLGSVLAGSNNVLWRITFGVFGLIGFVESLRFLRVEHPPSVRMVRVLRVLDPILYALVLVGVFNPGPTMAGLTPLQVEGILTGLLFMAGMAYLWVAFAGPVLHAPVPPAPGAAQPSAVPPGPGAPHGVPQAGPTQAVDPLAVPPPGLAGPAAPQPPWGPHPGGVQPPPSGARPPER